MKTVSIEIKMSAEISDEEYNKLDVQEASKNFFDDMSSDKRTTSIELTLEVPEENVFLILTKDFNLDDRKTTGD